MPATAWDVEANTVKELLAADVNRDHYTIQLQVQAVKGESPVYLAFGEAAVIGAGLVLDGLGAATRVLDAKARLALSAVSAVVNSGGIETMEDIEYRHTKDYPRWAQP